MRRIVPILAVTTACVVLAVCWAKRGSSSISAAFSHYGTYRDFTNQQFGFFVISNTGTCRLLCRGIGASSVQQFTEILLRDGWTNTSPWYSTAGYFYLSPGESHEVGIEFQTNLSWRIGFRFRDTGFVDHCPDLVWRVLPDGLRHVPQFQTVWTAPVPEYVAR
jgi:hypothetical protein